MLQLETTPEQSEYRLVLLSPGSRAIWAQRIGDDFRLPRIGVPRWERQAQQLQKSIAKVWCLRAIILDLLPSPGELGACAIVEILDGGSPEGLIIASINEISEKEMTSTERETVDAMLAGDPGTRGPFSRLGWIQEAKEWLRSALNGQITFTREIYQFNATGHFALVRFALEGSSAYWLKATGEPNTHEFQITRLLVQLCPEFLPYCIAAREDWNAWLMEDAGIVLDRWTLPALEQAVLSMATLQKRTVGHTGAFLASGAFDHRISVLRAQLGEIVEYLDETMTKQVSTKVRRIERGRLLEIASLLDDSCCQMEALNIPDTLIHNDINSGNILFNKSQCVFTDWCEVGIGNPFLTFQHLCILQPRDEEDSTTNLRDVYGDCWRHSLSLSKIERAFGLAPMLAILSCLYGRGTWLRSSRRNEPDVQSHARALARRMDREARDPRLLEALCP
jgi:hypothetical protein